MTKAITAQSRGGPPRAGAKAPAAGAAAQRRDRVEENGEYGARLRMLRTSRGLSLRAAATMAGITAGALSQIEKGRNSPSVSTLKKALGALGVSMGEFFVAAERNRQPGSFVFRAAEFVSFARSRGIRFMGLPGSTQSRAIEFLYETYAPGADTGPEAYSHEGEEGGFCLAGSVEITVGDKRELLGPGDGYYYSSKLPHRWRNIGRVPAVVVSGCTPPTF